MRIRFRLPFTIERKPDPASTCLRFIAEVIAHTGAIRAVAEAVSWDHARSECARALLLVEARKLVTVLQPPALNAELRTLEHGSNVVRFAKR